MNDIFTMIYPKLSKTIDFNIILDFINASYILALKTSDESPRAVKNGLSLKDRTIFLKGKKQGWSESINIYLTCLTFG